MDTLRLDRLELTNFRCFAKCDVKLHPTLTVFVAENGQGKTAILDALALALGPVVDELSSTRQWSGIGVGDIRQCRAKHGRMEPSVPTELSAHGMFDGKRLQWGVRRKTAGPRGRTTTKELKGLRSAVSSLGSRLSDYANHVREMAPPLPLIAYYGTGRLWAEQRLTEGRRRRDESPLGRLSGYQDCLSSSSSFKSFAAWYGDMAGAAKSPTMVAVDPSEHPVRLLAAVRDAAHTVLEPTGWTDLDWDFPEAVSSRQQVGSGGLVVEHREHGRLPLSLLSDGVRNMIALVADVAHRCARLNPQFGGDAAQRTPGVLLVDEVDMHLHPGWQQEAIGLIREAFPRLQIIATTHSPQVLSSVDHDSIRVVSVVDGVGELSEPLHQTRGVESADVLARVMRVHAVPRVEEARWLSEYRKLVQFGQDRSDEAATLWDRLVRHFGEDHPVMQEASTLRRLQEFKRAHGARGGEAT